MRAYLRTLVDGVDIQLGVFFAYIYRAPKKTKYQFVLPMNSTFGLLRQFISLQSRCRPLCCSSLYLNTTVAAVAVTGVDGGEIGGVDERAAAGGLKKYQNRRRLELASQYNRWLSPLLLYNRGYASDSGALNMSELTDLINSIVNRGARRGRTQDVAANEVETL